MAGGFNPTYAAVGDNKLDAWGSTDVATDWTITFASGDTYTAGGLALTAALFGLSRPIADVQVVGVNTAGFVYGWRWNTQTQKLMGLTVGVSPAAFVDLVASTSLTGIVLTVRVVTQR